MYVTIELALFRDTLYDHVQVISCERLVVRDYVCIRLLYPVLTHKTSVM